MQIDLLIKNGTVFNAYLKTFISADVAVLDGRIHYVGKTDTDLLKPKKVIDAKNKWILPGLIDIHMHIESSMATPYTFTNELVKHGVTTIVSEPHEIANVHGVEGVRAMIDACKKCDIDVFIGVPSSVPSTSAKLETSGGQFDVEELREMMDLDQVVCLGEFMNFNELVSTKDSKSHRILKLMRDEFPHYPVEGHCPKLTGLDLAKFIYYGVDSDHTQQSVEGMIERIQNGMFVQIQEKSMNKELFDAVKANNLYEHVCLVTDDVMPSKLMNVGHLDHLIKKAIQYGLSPQNAVYLATHTPAKRMKFSDRGAIAPGKLADIVIVDDIETFSVEYTLKNGNVIYDHTDDADKPFENPKFPDKFYESVQLEALNADDFELKSLKTENGHVTCRAMEVVNGTTYTNQVERLIRVENSRLIWEASDCLLIAIFERHGINKNVSLGLITGATIKEGALATTYAHDHHNLMVIGKSVAEMVLAANEVIRTQGGISVVQNDVILAKLDLPIGGILSDQPMAVIGEKTTLIEDALKGLGYAHYSPIMSMATNSLVVSPALKMTDVGLIDVNTSQVVLLEINTEMRSLDQNSVS